MSGHFILNLLNEPSASFIILYEMTTSVKFCLSYSMTFKNWIFSPSKWTIFQEENALLTGTLSMTLPLRAKVLLHVWPYDFYDTTLPTE